MPNRVLTTLLAVLLLATACTNNAVDDPEPAASEDHPTEESEGGEQTPTPDPEQIITDPGEDEALAEETAASRIVVQTAESNLFTILSDGTEREPLGEDTNVNTQPTWAPDSTFIGWSSVDASGVTSVAASRFDGSGDHRAIASGPITAIGWDPSSANVSYLAGVPNGRQLSVVPIAEPGRELALDTGSPLWYTWSPVDLEMLVHGDDFRIDKLDTEGNAIELSTNSGPFQSPGWVDADRALMFVDANDDEPSLVSTGDEGQGRLALASFDGYLRLVPSPDTNRVAVLVADSPPEISQIVTASFSAQQDEPVAIPQGRLHVLSVFGGSPTSLDGIDATAFMWNRDGTILAYLVQVTTGDIAMFEWRFWQDGVITAGPLFEATDEFLNQYVPYFDQVATNTTFFSPDSAQFVFAGRPIGSDQDGIWTFEIGGTGGPERLSEGVYAAWSSGAAGGGAESIL